MVLYITFSYISRHIVFVGLCRSQKFKNGISSGQDRRMPVRYEPHRSRNTTQYKINNGISQACRSRCLSAGLDLLYKNTRMMRFVPHRHPTHLILPPPLSNSPAINLSQAIQLLVIKNYDTKCNPGFIGTNLASRY